jgi:glutamate dehydrogenase
VRVDARDVRARVVAEGGNLGLTQRGRIEYWAGGGQINTDAVDNSAGVDMSDHEVNLKILVDLLVRSGVIKSRQERNRLLAEMTDEVSDLVLADNDQQGRAITLDGLRSAARYEAHVSFVEELVKAGIVNRKDDALPKRDELLASPARERGLPRPVLAVLLGHTKNWAFKALLATPVVDSAIARPFLDAYFPKRLRDGYAKHFEAHPLRREIIATCVVNYLVNHAGVGFLHQAMAATGADVGRVVEAYLEADREREGGAARAAVFGAGLPVEEEHARLLAIEDGIAEAVAAKLGGKTGRT